LNESRVTDWIWSGVIMACS